MGKTLVSYFSATGATKRLAEKIADTLDADIFEIEPVNKYTNEDLKWPSRDNRSCMEMKSKRFRPLVSKKLKNTEEYDTIFLGFPVWYYTAPTIINTFIEENDLSNKKIYIFVTSGSSTVDGSLNDLRNTYTELDVVGGKRFTKETTEEEIKDFIK